MTNTIRVMTVPVEGPAEIVELPKATLAEDLHRIVGGYFQCVPLIPEIGVYLWVNEDGKNTGLDFNVGATSLWVVAYGEDSGDFIVGDAVLTGPADSNGDTLGLSDEAIKALSAFYDVYSGA